MWVKRGDVRKSISVFFLPPQGSHIYVNHYNEKLVSFQRDWLKSLWLILVAQARKRSVMSSEAHCWMCFYGKLRAYRQLLKSESLTADLCAGKANVGCVFTQELPVRQELLTLVSILPLRCYKVSIKVYQSKAHFGNPCGCTVKNFKAMP